MKKTILLSLIISLIIPTLTFAEGFPKEDFFLKDGRLKETGGTEDLSTFEMFFFQTSHIANISISQGKVLVNQSVPVGYSLGEINQIFDGSGHLKVEGEYDSYSGTITGTFQFSDSEHYVKTFVGTDGKTTDGYGESEFSGKVKGNIVGGRALLSYSGRLTGTGRTQMADGNYENFTTDTPYTIKVVYSWEEKNRADPEVIDITWEGMGKDSGAHFSGLTGQIEWKMPNDPVEKWQTCDLDQQIPSGAMIKTSEDSKAIIMFPDMSTFVMKPETTIIITAPGEKDGKLKLFAGSIWANVRKMVIDGTMDIEMNQAVAGIKGTIFECSEKDNVSSLKVYKGIVSFTPTSGGKPIDVWNGQKISADSSGIKEKESFDADSELIEWSNIIASLEPEDEKNIDKSAIIDTPNVPRDISDNQSSDTKFSPPIILIIVMVLVFTGGTIAILKKKKNKV